MDKPEVPSGLFDGIRALAESAFPKRCGTCGRTFEDAKEFLLETQRIGGKTGFKQSVDDDDLPILEIYRNCPCGSTLMDFFSDRRDLSDRGLARRQQFEDLLNQLAAQGMERGLARAELLKVLNGQHSALVSAMMVSGKSNDSAGE
jgi:hypothetical protein